MQPEPGRTRIPASTRARLIEGNRQVRIIGLYPAEPLTYGPLGGWSYTPEDGDPIEIAVMDEFGRETDEVRTVRMDEVDSLQ